jgi:NADPH-dependent F420 reductase
MNIAIIGAGKVGRALAGASVRAGHTVIMSSAHPENAQRVAGEVGAQAATSNKAAAEAADVVVLAIPYTAMVDLLDEIGDSLRGKIVVDVTNPTTPDYSGLALVGTSAAEQIQARVPGARVVKAFNSALAARQADPQIKGTQLDGFVAGDDADAKAVVLELAKSIGFRPIDAGPLAMARALEALALLNITLQIRTNGTWQSGWKLVGATGAA